jgi:hypothetical protein
MDVADMRLNRQLDRTRIELLCRGGTADPSAVLAACMRRNVFGLLARAARIKGNDLFRELGDVSFISKFTGDGGSFSRDAPPKLDDNFEIEEPVPEIAFEVMTGWWRSKRKIIISQ